MVYEELVDQRFWMWLSDESTTTVEKLGCRMISKYRDLHGIILGEEKAKQLNSEGIRRRINNILVCHGYHMRTPKLLDAKRCIRYETLRLWFENEDVVKALTSVHPMFLFNADKTEINRKGGAPGKVACKEGEQPCLVVEDRSGSHVSLFLVVSATGERMDTIVFHGKPHQYVKPALFLKSNCMKQKMDT